MSLCVACQLPSCLLLFPFFSSFFPPFFQDMSEKWRKRFAPRNSRQVSDIIVLLSCYQQWTMNISCFVIFFSIFIFWWNEKKNYRRDSWLPFISLFPLFRFMSSCFKNQTPFLFTISLWAFLYDRRSSHSMFFPSKLFDCWIEWNLISLLRTWRMQKKEEWTLAFGYSI